MKSQFVCVAVEGGTTDGRTIEASWIQEMAANYNTATYTANVNIEHIHGYSPEPPFNCYGQVVALEARTIDLPLNGKTEKRVALFAQIDANDQLVALAKRGQKLFPSIEVNPNFAGKGQAYCQGLAMTDGPASLGTEMLKFASTAKISPLAHRKAQPGNLFTASDELDGVVLQFLPDTPVADAASKGGIESFIAAFRAAFSNPGAALTPAAAPASAPAAAAVSAAAPAGQAGQAVNVDAMTAAFTQALTALGEQITTLSAAQDRRLQKTEQTLAQLQSELTALNQTQASTPAQGYSQRPLATGTDGAVVTDC